MYAYTDKQNLKAYVTVDPVHSDKLYLPDDEGLSLWVDRLQQGGIVHGLNEVLLRELSQNPAKMIEEDPMVIAKASPPVHEGVQIKHFFNLSRRVRTEVGGRVDYKMLGYGCDVFEGQLLAEQKVDQEGQDGMNVRGEKIPFDKQEEKSIEYNDNVIIEKSGNCTKFYAKIDGILINDDPVRLEVFPYLHIRGNVDFKTGNLSTKCDVVIDRDVSQGFSVRADGDITVKGLIETKVNLESGGHIHIVGGVASGSRLIAKGNVEFHHAQGVHIECFGDVNVKSYLFDCELRAKGFLYCKNPSVSDKRGVVVGGTVNALAGMEITSVGSRTNMTTLVSGHDFFHSAQEKELKLNILGVEEDIKRQLRRLGVDVFKGKILDQLDKLPEKERVQARKVVRHILLLKNTLQELKSQQESLKSRNFGKILETQIKVVKKCIPDFKVNISNCEQIVYEKSSGKIFQNRDGKIIASNP